MIIILYRCKKEYFKVNNFDNDTILSENYRAYDFKSENKFNRYLINRNQKYENIFRGSILNKYYKLLDLNITF